MDQDIYSAIRGNAAFEVVYLFLAPEQNSDKYWMVERLSVGGPLQVRWGRRHTKGAVSNVGISPPEVISRINEKTAKGYKFYSFLRKSKPKISDEFPGMPWGEIRRFSGDNALNAAGEVLMALPPDVRETLYNTYLLE